MFLAQVLQKPGQRRSLCIEIAIDQPYHTSRKQAINSDETPTMYASLPALFKRSKQSNKASCSTVIVAEILIQK